MADFSEEEVVAFAQVLKGFEDALVLSKLVDIYPTSDEQMARSGDVIWRPMPYIMQSFDGEDQTTNFVDPTQISVPATLGYEKSVPFKLSAKELRDQLQQNRLGRSAYQKLASDINVAVMNVLANQSTVFVKRSAAASGFGDISEADAAFNELGVDMNDRCIALSSRDYNDMASNLAARQTLQGKALNAYERAYIGMNSGFETFKLDYANRLTAAAGTTVTVTSANQRHVPQATSTAATGEKSNVDNRTMTLALTVGGGAVKAGDAFTIAGVNAVHHITKEDTGQLKTFRVIEAPAGGGTGNYTISPPIISADGASPTAAEQQYKNCTAAPAAAAVVTFLNTVTAAINPFWTKGAIELLPGSLEVPENSGAAVMKGSTENGIEITMMKQFGIDNRRVKYRFDAFFGVALLQPQMAGLMMFSQT